MSELPTNPPPPAPAPPASTNPTFTLPEKHGEPILDYLPENRAYLLPDDDEEEILDGAELIPFKPTRPLRSRGDYANFVADSLQREGDRLVRFGPRLIKRIDAVIEVLYDQAMQGAPWAIKEILDRFLGRPNQPIEATGDVQVLMIRGASLSEL